MATSRALLAAEEKGAEILHNGAPVTYLPRRPGDRKPWLLRNDRSQVRYTAAQCTAYWPTRKEE